MRLLIATAALLLTSLTAYADTLTTFNLNSNFSGDPVTGTLVIDTTIGSVTAISLTSNNYGTLTGVTSQGGTMNYGQALYYIDGNTSTGGSVDLLLPVGSLVGYTGSDICIFGSGNCKNVFAYYGQEFASSGSLTVAPNSVTPEPASFALLGTGLLGVMGVVRRHPAS